MLFVGACTYDSRWKYWCFAKYKHFVQALLRRRQTGGCWTAAVRHMSLHDVMNRWLGQWWQGRRGKRDYTRKLYPTTNLTLKIRRSNRCFRLPFTFPTTLYAFVDRAISFSSIIVLVMSGEECKLRRSSVCSARSSPVTFPAFVTRLDFIVLLKSAMNWRWWSC